MPLPFVAMMFTLSFLGLRVNINVALVFWWIFILPRTFPFGEASTVALAVPPIYAGIPLLLVLFPMLRKPKPKSASDIGLLIAVSLLGIALLAVLGRSILLDRPVSYEFLAIFLLAIPGGLTHYFIDRRKL